MFLPNRERYPSRFLTKPQDYRQVGSRNNRVEGALERQVTKFTLSNGYLPVAFVRVCIDAFPSLVGSRGVARCW